MKTSEFKKLITSVEHPKDVALYLLLAEDQQKHRWTICSSDWLCHNFYFQWKSMSETKAYLEKIKLSYGYFLRMGPLLISLTDSISPLI